MFRHKYAVFGAGCLLAVTVACSNTATPISPNAAVPGSFSAGPNGETLKIAAPGTTSPSGGATSSFPLTLTIANVNGTYATFPVSYRYEIRNAAGTTVATGTQAASSGATTSIVVNTTLAFDANHTWRVRAENGSSFGPWSAAASFKSPAGSFIRGNEVLDLLYDGATVGQRRGNTEFIPGVGIRLNAWDSYVAYELPQNLQTGEYSFMATNVDEGNVGDKMKVMSMGEGCHGDITSNDYRFTLEVRGNMYPQPGAVQGRIITGDADEHNGRITDFSRVQVSWNRNAWYFFKLFWSAETGRAGYEIREGGPTGPFVLTESRGTSGHPYRPVPHCVYIGSPVARGGLQDSTHQGMIAKNVWVSGNPRPTFPSIIGMGQ